jgi:predicted nucleic acid-binding protein
VSPLPFLDTNVFVRHIVADQPVQSPRATVLFERIERGELSVRTAATVVFETVYVLERTYHVARHEIRDALLPLLELPGIRLPGKTIFRAVFDLYVNRRAFQFADCYHALLMQRLGLTEIITFDQAFDRVPGITRTEP